MNHVINLFLLLAIKRHALMGIFMLLIYQQGNSQCTVDAGEDIHICLDQSGSFDTVQINAKILEGTAPYTIKWLYSYRAPDSYTVEKASDILNDTSLLNPLVVQRSALSSTYLTVNVTDSSGNTCTDSMMYSYSLFYMILGDRLSFISKGDTASIYAGGESGFQPYTYKWTPNYNISDTSVGAPSVWPEHDQSYQATLTDSKGCKHTQPWSVYVSTTNVEEQKSGVFKVYPNPVKGKLYFQCVSKSLDKAIANITDINGRFVIRERLNNNYINVHSLPKGVYYYTLSKQNKIIHSGSFTKE